MKEYAIPGTVQTALNRARTIGVCVDFVFFHLESLSDDDLHQQAALTGMYVLSARADAWRQSHLPSEPWPVSVNDLTFTFSVNPQAMQSFTVTLAEFFAPEIEKTFIGDEVSAMWGGFREAFLDPPYGLNPHAAEAELLYAKVSEFLTAGSPEIRRWSADWSNYFYQGKEWWGTYYWTILNREAGWIAVVGASTTD